MLVTVEEQLFLGVNMLLIIGGASGGGAAAGVVYLKKFRQ